MSVLANHNPTGGQSYRHTAVQVSAVAVGCLLFAASRKLVWGRAESLGDIGLWVLAILPYACYFVLTKLVPSSREFLRGADFLAIWTCSLLAFVLLRASSFSGIYEDVVYDAFGPGAVRYFILSAIYIGFGFVAVVAWRFLRTHLDSFAGMLAQRALSFLVGVVFFCSGIFLIAL